MSGWAKPGTKVVCVVGGRIYGHGHDPINGYPVEKMIYTIASVQKHPFGGLCISLKELPHPSLQDGVDWGFAIERFRPLITKTLADDVEMFLRLANPSPLERLDRLAEELDSLYND